MIRVLVTVNPRMYRQAMALSIRRQRPGLDVRVARPEDTGREVAEFRPHLLVHNDNDGLGPEYVASVPCRVTVLYSDGMDARISADGQVSTERDMSTEDLLQVVDVAIALAERETGHD
jgi:hypothetical protein